MRLIVPSLHGLNLSCHLSIKQLSVPLRSRQQFLDLLEKVWGGYLRTGFSLVDIRNPSTDFPMFPLQCQKRYFSAWHKLILDHRIKLGKAGTLSDWKLQLKVLRAWRDYTRSQKLRRETQAMENDLREENRYYYLCHENPSSMFM